MPGFLSGAAKGLQAYAVRQEEEERRAREKADDRAYESAENDRRYDRARKDQLSDKADEAGNNEDNYRIVGDEAVGTAIVNGQPVEFRVPKGSPMYNRVAYRDQLRSYETRTKGAQATVAEYNATEGLQQDRERHRSAMETDKVTRAAAGRRGYGDSDKGNTLPGEIIADEFLKGYINKFELAIPGKEFDDLFGEELDFRGLNRERYKKKGALQLLAADAVGHNDPKIRDRASSALNALAPYIRRKAEGKADTKATAPGDGLPPARQTGLSAPVKSKEAE